MQIEHKNKIQFKAGKFDYDPLTKKVNPNKSPGWIKIVDIDGQKMFTWTNLDTNNNQIQLILCPNDAKFTVVKNKALHLSFQSFQDKYFFWVQDKQIVPQQIAQKIQSLIDYQQQFVSEPIQSSHQSEPQPQQKSNQKQQIPNHEHLPAKQPTFKIDQSFIQRMQQNLLAKKLPQLQAKPIHLSEIVNNQLFKFCQQNFNEQFLQYLPEGQKQKDQFRQNIISPQFSQAVEMLDDVLNSQGGISLFYEMRLDTNFNNYFYGTQAFLRALQKWGKQERQKQQKKQ